MTAALSTFLVLLAQALPEKECLETAKMIESSIREGGAWLDKTFDVDVMVERGLRNMKVDDKFKAAFRTGVKRSFAIGRQSAEVASSKGGSFTFLRLKPAGAQTRAIFRLIGEDSFNYQEYLLEAGPGGVRMVDYMTYLNGEWVSEAIMRMSLTALSSQPGGLAKAVGKENVFIESFPKVKQMETLRSQGKLEDALKLYDTLPDVVKKEKSVLIVRCVCAGMIGGKTGLDALEAFKKAHPGDPSTAILSLAPYTAARRFEDALSAIDLLDQALGGDAYLDYQRAEVHFAAEAIDKSRQAAAKAIEREETLAEPHWMMVTLSMREKRYAETAKWLTVLEKRFKIVLGDLKEAEGYQDFVRSPEYKAWMESKRP